MSELSPPSNDFSLNPPAAVAPVPMAAAAGQVKLSAPEVLQLDTQVREFVETISSFNCHDAPFKECVARVHNMGNKDIELAASVSNRMLERPVKSLKNGLFDSGSDISGSLVDLRQTIEKLDPSRQGDLFQPRKLLGFIPFGSKIEDYFDEYQSSQSHINGIIEALKRGKDELLRDNTAIEQEKTNLWELMQRLEKYVYIGKKLDAELEQKAQSFDAIDTEKARIVREELLFYTRQKVMDLLTQQAVNIQGYLALDLIRKNNLELMKGVDRATTTTVSALRTAVMVAQALVNQKLVLTQIQALNTTTGNLIESTSEMLKQQSTEIHNQAANSTIEIGKLQKAFDNIYQTMDAIATFKIQALGSMQNTVTALGNEVSKAQTYLDRTRNQESAAALQSTTNTVQL